MAAPEEVDSLPLERRRKRNSKHAPTASTVPKYSITSRTGGRFSNLKAVFSKDEKYCFLSTRKETRVYSTTTGELVRALKSSDIGKDLIVSILLLPDNEYRLATVSAKGQILIWDWTDGSLIRKYSLAAATEVVASLLIGTTFLWSDGKQICMGLDFPKCSKTLTVAKMSVCHGFCYNGERILAYGDKTICMFKLKTGSSTEHEHSTLASASTAFALSKSAYAYADTTGAIYIHQIATQEMDKDIAARKLHWHSSTVNTLEFALNGQYLLSGGEEGVLVLWQLASSNRQYLPRISHHINTISASPTSKLYALKLEDNSVKLINATDLELQAEIVGPRAVTGTASCAARDDEYLITAGTDAQIWNMSSGRTALNISITTQTFAGQVRDDYRANEASITACSVNGDWLASLDSWCPPKEEAVELGYTQPQDEIHLKFWKWSGTTYELVARIDNPHGMSRVTQIISARNELFYTVGDDASVKVWRRKPVKRDLFGGGTEVTGSTWTCSRIFKLTRSISPCKIALSIDSSILALHTQDQTFLIDPASGDLKTTLSGLSTGKVVSIGFVHHHLVILGFKRLVVWDLLLNDLAYALCIPAHTTELQLACGPRTFAVTTNEQSKQVKNNAKVFVFDPTSPKPIFREKCVRTVALAYTTQGFTQLTDDLEVVTISNVAPASTSKEMMTLQEQTLGISSLYRPLHKPTQVVEDVDMQETVVTSQALTAIFEDPVKTLEDRFEDLALLVLGSAHSAFEIVA